MGDQKSWEFLQSTNHEFEAHIYDPLYIDCEEEGDHVLRDDDDLPIALYDQNRLESSQFLFYSDAVPMETFHAIKPAGQTSPLFPRTFPCRLFHPSRELYNERACPVLLVPTQARLWRITELPCPIPKEIASTIVCAYRAILDAKLVLGDYLESIRIREDGSVVVSEWENLTLEEVDENDESDLREWRKSCVELVGDLTVRLGDMGLK
jgi:hypothetical protein